MAAQEVEQGAVRLPSLDDVLVGKYRIERILGRGGMGVVYAAEHIELGKRVAVKVLHAEASRRPEALRRFQNEARAAARIESEYVVRVIDVGTSDEGAPFMVLEYLDGSDLAQLAREQAISAEEAVEFVLQALEGIAQAHALGIVHRDLKPANLFLAKRADGTSRIKVLDFGISKNDGLAMEPSAITSASAIVGSPSYLSPEQLRSARDVDARADIWAMGVILYELLSGRLPFRGPTLGHLFVAILEQTPEPLDVAPELRDVVRRCLERSPETRFKDVAELAAALAPFAAEGKAAAARVKATLTANKSNDAIRERASIPPPRTPTPARLAREDDPAWRNANHTTISETSDASAKAGVPAPASDREPEEIAQQTTAPWGAPAQHRGRSRVGLFVMLGAGVVIGGIAMMVTFGVLALGGGELKSSTPIFVPAPSAFDVYVPPIQSSTPEDAIPSQDSSLAPANPPEALRAPSRKPAPRVASSSSTAPAATPAPSIEPSPSSTYHPLRDSRH